MFNMNGIPSHSALISFSFSFIASLNLLTLLRNIAITLLLGAVLSACNSDSPTPSQPNQEPEPEAIVQMGSGVNAAFVPKQAKVENADLDYNGSTTISVSLVNEQNAPVSEQYSVTFSSTCSANDMAEFDNPVVSALAGVASAVYTAQGCEGEDVVTVTATVGGTELTATATLTIAALVKMGTGVNDAFVPGQAKVEKAQLQYGASTTISISLVDKQNTPVSEEYSVKFSSPCFADNLAAFDNPIVSTTAGVASAVYSAQGCEGEDVVTVTATVGSTELTATATLTIAALVKMGTGVNDAFVPGQAKVEKAQLQYGASTTISVSLVDKQNTPVSEEYSVKFSSSCFADNLAVFDNPIVSTTAGVASAVYSAQGCEGEDVVTVTATVGSTELTATATLTITEAQVLSIEGVSVEYPQLQLAGMGLRETSKVTFRVLGPDSKPLVGQEVRFAPSLSRGGIEILEEYRTAVSDKDGLVTTVLKSGTIVASVSVIATHTASEVFGQSDSIIISTGIPVLKRFSLAAEPYNPLDAFRKQGVPVTFSVILSDRFGHSVPDGTKVTFVSEETGNVGNGACIVVSGRCSITWISANSERVDDDGRVTVFAYVEGMEYYDDHNANYVFDSGDTFNIAEDDLGEPFADNNEDGMHGPNEYLLEFDFSDDGVRSDGDGEWNGPCMTGVNPSAICPPENKRSIILSRQIVFVLPRNEAIIFDPGNFRSLTMTGAGVEDSKQALSGLIVSDSRNNSLPVGTTISFLLDGDKGLELEGKTSYTIKNNVIAPHGPIGITVRQPDLTKTGNSNLILRISVPGIENQDFFWDIDF